MNHSIYKRLIGKTALVENNPLCIIEVLFDEEIVVVGYQGERNNLQQNQFGDVHRRSQRTQNIALRSELNRYKLHPVLQHFVNDAERAEIETLLKQSA